MGPSVSWLPGDRAANTHYISRFFISEPSEVTKMEYLIVLGVVSMMALYVLIIARCLKQPEWQ
jgi:hypothetical protein